MAMAFPSSGFGARRPKKLADACRIVSCAGCSDRSRAGNLRAPHEAPEGSRIMDREMLAAAIIPESDRAGLPAKTTRKLGAMSVLEQILEQRPAFLLAHAFEALRVGAVDIKQLAPGF